MAATIYYFTSTGNSLQIARQLAAKLGNCTITSMATQPPSSPVGGPDATVGFVFPVYYVGLPRIVKRFTEKLDIQQGTYCFAVINYGGSKLDTLGMLNDALQKKGVHLSYGEGVKMPDNYIPRYDSASPEEAQKIIDAALVKVDSAAEAIASHQARPIKRKAKLLGKVANYLFMYRNIEGFDKKFFATNACIGCGLCSEICPVSNIVLEDKRPVWQHHCERCMACIHWCPTKAIQYGKKTAARSRYHNPHVKVQEIIAGNKGLTSGF